MLLQERPSGCCSQNPKWCYVPARGATPIGMGIKAVGHSCFLID